MSGGSTEKTLRVWQARSKRELTHGDVRQIASNLTHFLKILSEWEAAEVAPYDQRRRGESGDKGLESRSP